MIEAAERPVLYVGSTVGNAESREAVYALAEKYALPVCTTNRRPHFFDSAHSHYAGYIGIRTPPALLDEIKRCDLLIALGERLTDPVSQSYTFPMQPVPQVPLVHVWPDAQEIGRVWVPALGLACDPATLVAELNQSPANIKAPDARRAWVAHLHTLQERVTAPQWEDVEDGVNFAAVVCEINKHLRADAAVTSDAGNFSTFIHRYTRFRKSQVFLSSVVGAMGSGVPMAVAAALADPKRQVIGYVGDGGAMMTGNELATARLYNVAPVIVVADNHAYGTIAMHQRTRYPGNEFRPSTELFSPDFAAWGRSFGARGISIAGPDEIAAKIAEALSPSTVPTVVHVRTSPTQATAWRRLAQ
jgi:acetolactate synthase-1/2/3 large subunit